MSDVPVPRVAATNRTQIPTLVTHDGEPLLTMTEVCHRLNRSEVSVRKYINQGRLDSALIMNRRLFTESAVKALAATLDGDR